MTSDEFFRLASEIEADYRKVNKLPPIKTDDFMGKVLSGKFEPDLSKGVEAAGYKPVEHRDFRDTGNPLAKVYPLTSWQSWERKDDTKKDPPFGGRT